MNSISHTLPDFIPAECIVDHDLEFAVVSITPELASLWLETSTGNRDYRTNSLEKIRLQMATGKWRLNGESISFDEFGKLMEGHHRLKCSVETGVTFESVVVWNVPRSSMPTINTGAPRNASDYLKLAKLPSSSHIRATLTRLLDWEKGRLHNAGNNTHLNEEYEKALYRHPNVPDSVKRCWSLRNLAAPSQVAWLYSLTSVYHPDKAEEFFVKFETGANLALNDPAYALRERFLNAKMRNGRTLLLPEAIAIEIKAWNACLQEKTVRTLKFQDNEPFPVLLGVPHMGIIPSAAKAPESAVVASGKITRKRSPVVASGDPLLIPRDVDKS